VYYTQDNNKTQMPSLLGRIIIFSRTVETLPSTVNITAAQAARGIQLSSIRSGDTFQVKFVVNTQDGRRFDAFHDGICDETRGEAGDCRVVIRVDTRTTIYQPLH